MSTSVSSPVPISPNVSSTLLTPAIAMADILSILGFVLHVTHRVYTTIQLVRDASSDIRTLHDDAIQVHAFLRILLGLQNDNGQGSVRVGDVTSPQLEALVTKAQVLVTMADLFIKRTTTQNDDGIHVVKKLKWPLYAREAKKLSEHFRSFYVSLTTVFVVSNSYVFLPYCTP